MIFDMIQLSKSYRNRYINTMQCLSAKSCTCFAYLIYHNKYTHPSIDR